MKLYRITNYQKTNEIFYVLASSPEEALRFVNEGVWNPWYSSMRPGYEADCTELPVAPGIINVKYLCI